MGGVVEHLPKCERTVLSAMPEADAGVDTAAFRDRSLTGQTPYQSFFHFMALLLDI